MPDEDRWGVYVRCLNCGNEIECVGKPFSPFFVDIGRLMVQPPHAPYYDPPKMIRRKQDIEEWRWTLAWLRAEGLIYPSQVTAFARISERVFAKVKGLWKELRQPEPHAIVVMPPRVVTDRSVVWAASVPAVMVGPQQPKVVMCRVAGCRNEATTRGRQPTCPEHEGRRRKMASEWMREGGKRVRFHDEKRNRKMRH